MCMPDVDLQLTEPVALEKLKPKPKPLSAAERMKNLSAEQLEQLQQFISELEKKWGGLFICVLTLVGKTKNPYDFWWKSYGWKF